MNTQLENEIYIKLKEAECQAMSTDDRYTSEEVMGDLRKRLIDKIQ